MVEETPKTIQRVPELLKEKEKLERELILERAKLAASAKKNSPKIKLMRRKIARVETNVSILIGKEINKP